MELSKRLLAVTQLVSHPVMADIGTDHGYVPIYLHKIGKVTKAFACDVRRGPLEKARENIRQHGAEGAIETRLGSGLTPLLPGEVHTAVMAGMGGMLTVHILEDSPQVVGTLQELVLAPQHDIDAVRRYVHKIGFAIDTEQMLIEEGKVYNILRCVPGTEKYDREIDYLYGKKLLEQKEALLFDILKQEEKKYGLVEEHLVKSGTPHARHRLPVVKEKLERMREALACMQP